MSVILNPKLQERIAAKLESGEYRSADEVVEKGLDLLDGKEARPATTELNFPIWDRIIKLGQQVPDEEWADVPTDFARNLEHYLYGAPKESDPE